MLAACTTHDGLKSAGYQGGDVREKATCRAAFMFTPVIQILTTQAKLGCSEVRGWVLSHTGLTNEPTRFSGENRRFDSISSLEKYD